MPYSIQVKQGIGWRTESTLSDLGKVRARVKSLRKAGYSTRIVKHEGSWPTIGDIQRAHGR